jgi:uncharacterized protein
MWSPSAPLSPSSADGFAMNESIQELIKSSFKMLLLTNPGERVMYPTFGVGLKTFLFERFGQDVYSKIQTRIRKQVAAYLPPVKILNIEFDDSTGDQYQLGLRIEYAIVSLGIQDWIDVFV